MNLSLVCRFLLLYNNVTVSEALRQRLHDDEERQCSEPTPRQLARAAAAVVADRQKAASAMAVVVPMRQNLMDEFGFVDGFACFLAGWLFISIVSFHYKIVLPPAQSCFAGVCDKHCHIKQEGIDFVDSGRRPAT